MEKEKFSKLLKDNKIWMNSPSGTIIEGQLSLLDVMRIAIENQCEIRVAMLPGDIEDNAQFEVKCLKGGMSVRTLVPLMEVQYAKTFLLETVIRNNCNTLETIYTVERNGD